MKVSEGLSRVKSLLGHWGTPRELPPQLTWKYAHEPELLGWRIKARNYNTVIANGLFFFLAGGCCLVWVFCALKF